LHGLLREYNAGTGAAVCGSEIAKQGLRVTRRR